MNESPVRVWHGDALEMVATLSKISFARYDLILTSPPAYPPGLSKNRLIHVGYLGRLVRRCRLVMADDAFLVLAIQEHPDHPILEPLAHHLQHSGLRLLRTIRWRHDDVYPTWIVFLGKGSARLGDRVRTDEWLLNHPTPDTDYGWLEFPQEIVDRVVAMTIPNGGRILDPFIGKGEALSRLGPKYTVTGIDLALFGEQGNVAPADSGMGPP